MCTKFLRAIFRSSSVGFRIPAAFHSSYVFVHCMLSSTEQQGAICFNAS